MSRNRLLPAIASAATPFIVLANAPPAPAADKSWSNFFGGVFSDPGNWQGQSPAGAADIAHFGLTTNPSLAQRAYTVSFNSNATNQALKIEDDFVTFDLNGRTYATTLAGGTEIGNVAGRTGRLTITDGTMSVFVNSELLIGSIASASGSLTVGAGGQLFGNPVLSIGHFGTGTMTITAGGRATSGGFLNYIGFAPGSTGTVNVDGANSVWTDNSAQLNIGNDGHGALNITNGGQVHNATVAVARNAGATGVVNVSGASQWTSSADLVLGLAGSATLEITQGGRVRNENATIGQNTGSTGVVTVDGPNSQWINDGELIVGNVGRGTLDVNNGGAVSAASTVVGQVDGPGIGTIKGPGSMLNTANLTVGGGLDGIAQLTVEGAGNVSAGEGVINNGTIIVRGAGSTLTTSGLFVVGLLRGPATLNISDGGLVKNDLVRVGNFVHSTSGTVNVDGANSKWVTGSLLVGGVGDDHTVNITGGGVVDSGNTGVVGNDGPGAVSVSGSGSTWTTFQQLHVGSNSTGTLNIADGGQVRTGNGSIIGVEATGIGVVTIAGPGSHLISDARKLAGLIVGAVGAGTLDITDGGRVTTTTAFLGSQPGSRGTVTVTGAGSRLATAGNLRIGSNGGTGTLNITNGATATLGGDVTGGSGASTLTLDGGTLDMQGHNLGGAAPVSTLNLRGGALKNVGQINNGAALIKTTSGTLVLEGVNTYTGDTTVLGGTLVASSSANLGSAANSIVLNGGAIRTDGPITSTRQIQINAGGGTFDSNGFDATFGPLAGGAFTKNGAGALSVKNIRTTALTISAGTVRILSGDAADPASVLGNLAIATGAAFDLANNDLVIDNGDLPATLAHFTTGRLVSSAATPVTTLAIVKNDAGTGISLHSTFSGESVDAADVLVKYTYTGDADLDGRVSISDFFAADRGLALRLSGWQNGDFNHSGGIPDAADFMLLDRSFLSQGIPLALPPSSAAPVPEPATLSLLLLTPGLLIRRRASGATLHS